MEPLKPRVGSIVMYYSHGSKTGEYPPEPAPAIVTKIIDEQRVHLTIFRENGMHFKAVLYSETPKPGYWSWEA